MSDDTYIERIDGFQDGYLKGLREREAEIARLKSEKQYVLDVLHAAEEEIHRLTAEVERLRAPLHKFVDHYPSGINPWLDEAKREARAALSGTDATATALDRLGWVDGIRKLVDDTDAPAGREEG